MGTTKKSTDQNRVAKGLSAATRSLLVSSVLYVSLSSGNAPGRCIDGASRGCEMSPFRPTGALAGRLSGSRAIDVDRFLCHIVVGQYPTEIGPVNFPVA